MSLSLLNPKVMWRPKENLGKISREFKDRISKKYNLKFDDHWSFHRWTVENFRTFWAELWLSAGIIHSTPYSEVCPTDVTIADAKKWFPGARMNFAENMLKFRDNHTACIAIGESRQPRTITYAEMYKESCMYGAALKKLGLKSGDVVSCYMSNREECVFAMLGTTSAGAIWSGALPLLGAKAVLNRFTLTGTKFLFTIDRFLHNGKEIDMLSKVKEISEGLTSLVKIIIVPSRPDSLTKNISEIKNSCFLPDFLAMGCNEDGSVPDLVFVQLPFDHPVFISYTSGTTGVSKTIVHGFACILTAYRNFGLHRDSERGDIWLSVSPVGWASWIMLTCLQAQGITVVAFEGIPHFMSPTAIWDIIDQYSITHLFFAPSILDCLESERFLPTEKNHLSSLRFVMSAGSVVKLQNFEFVYKVLKNDAIFVSSYGCTEVMGFCYGSEFSVPVHLGEAQSPVLGEIVKCLDESGNSLMGEVGELVIVTPTPTLPLFLWGDKDGTLYKEMYFSKYKDVFALHDLGVINPITNGLIVHGRSDETLKPEGVRFGSSEIYNVVDRFAEVKDSICVSQRNADNTKERVVLFLKMQEGYLYSEDLLCEIRLAIARELTEGHVPKVILETKDIPYNLNGKKMESTVKRIINNMSCDSENINNPDCLLSFFNLPQLQSY